MQTPAVPRLKPRAMFTDSHTAEAGAGAGEEHGEDSHEVEVVKEHGEDSHEVEVVEGGSGAGALLIKLAPICNKQVS